MGIFGVGRESGGSIVDALTILRMETTLEVSLPENDPTFEGMTLEEYCYTVKNMQEGDTLKLVRTRDEQVVAVGIYRMGMNHNVSTVYEWSL